MPPRPPVRYGLLRPRLQQPPDCFWVSEDVLDHAFHRFAVVSRTAKRHGSFQPDIFESRRRLGRRRMTHNSEFVPSPGFVGFWGLWGWGGPFGEVDRTKWTWEAPTPRISEPRAKIPRAETPQASTPPASNLAASDRSQPSVLNSLLDKRRSEDEATQSILGTLKASEVAVSCKQRPMSVRDDILDFVTEFQRASQGSKLDVCDAYSYRLRKRLELNLVRQKDFLFALDAITSCIRGSCADQETADATCLCFYRHVWKGMFAAESVASPPLDDRGTSHLLHHLSKLPYTSQVRSLIYKILRHQDNSSREIKKGLTEAVVQWVRSWSPVGEQPITYDTSLLEAPQKIDTMRLELTNLAEALSTLSAPMINACSYRIFELPGLTVYSKAIIRSYWIYVLAQLPKSEPLQLFSALRMADRQGVLPEDFVSETFINYCISHGFTSPKRSKALEFQMHEPDFPASQVLIKLSKWCPNQLHCQVLHLLRKYLNYLEKYHVAYPFLVLKILRRFQRDNSTRQRFSKPEQWPQLVLSLVDHPDISAAKVWLAIGVPIYPKLKRSIRRRFCPQKTLSPDFIHLIQDMTVRFALDPNLSPRAAMRNAENCIHHLRRYNAPIGPIVTRALTRIAVTGNVMEGKGIGRERLDWILYHVRRAEGLEVHNELEEIVNAWHNRLQHERDKVWMRQNPLRVGPID